MKAKDVIKRLSKYPEDMDVEIEIANDCSWITRPVSGVTDYVLHGKTTIHIW